MFKGTYKAKDSYGNPIYYTNGDVVLDQGRAYRCLSNTIYGPLQSPDNWYVTGLTEPYRGTTAPINPIENQIWVTDSGTKYIWFKDTNGFQWIEI